MLGQGNRNYFIKGGCFMTNIFDGKICSFYKNVIEFQQDKKHLSTPGINRPILDILTKEGYTNQNVLNDLRINRNNKEFYTKTKRTLSAATFSTVQDDMTISRSDDNVLFHTGFISVDIDVEKNPSLLASDELKDYIINEIPYMAYLGRSVSNIGLWGLIPIAYKDEHYAHFRAIVKHFGDRGIYLDTPTSDISRLRFIAYDPDSYIELNPQVFYDTIETKEDVQQNRYIRTDINENSDEFFRVACRWVEVNHNLKFEKGYIHNYLLRLYALLRYAHVDRDVCLSWIYKNLISKEQVTTNCLDEIEFKK